MLDDIKERLRAIWCNPSMEDQDFDDLFQEERSKSPFSAMMDRFLLYYDRRGLPFLSAVDASLPQGFQQQAESWAYVCAVEALLADFPEVEEPMRIVAQPCNPEYIREYVPTAYRGGFNP